MKKLLRSAVIGASLFVAAFTALGDAGPINVNATNNVAASSTATTGMGDAIDVSNFADVSVDAEFKTAAADTSTGVITLLFSRSLDGTKYETTPRLSYIIPHNSTTVQVGVTNFPAANIGAAKYLKLYSIQNGTTNTLTNIVVRIGVKTIR